jgi:hypothetical protein
MEKWSPGVKYFGVLERTNFIIPRLARRDYKTISSVSSATGEQKLTILQGFYTIFFGKKEQELEGNQRPAREQQNRMTEKKRGIYGGRQWARRAWRTNQTKRVGHLPQTDPSQFSSR